MHYEFSVESEDEIGYLAASLSYMASEIARSEDDQKKFVANVSHDFRSPLTSIKGVAVALEVGSWLLICYPAYIKSISTLVFCYRRFNVGFRVLNLEPFKIQ